MTPPIPMRLAKVNDSGSKVAKAFTLAELAEHVFPVRRPVLLRRGEPVLREGHLAEVYAERGFGKTWFVQTLALVAAGGVEALGFTAPGPLKVTYIDGEMGSEEIQDRFRILSACLGVASSAAITVVGADWQDECLPRLDTREGQAFVEPFVATADVLILDNRSCLFDPEGEKDPAAWQPAQEYLLSLRRLGKAVIVVHHSNRQGGARGISKAEDSMNLLVKLSKPEDYSQDQGARFLVTFEKSRGVFGDAVAPFLAHLTPDGWQVQAKDAHQDEITVSDKLLEQVRLAAKAGEPVKSASAAIRSARVNKKAGLKAWAALIDSHQLLKARDGGFRVR